MMDNKLMVVPQSHVCFAWDNDGANALGGALGRSDWECTPSQLKLMLMRGEMVLIRYGRLWAAVHPQDMPNSRVLHVYAVAGEGIGNGSIAAIADYAKAIGCQSITCAANGGAERLYSRFGFEPKYTVMERKI